MSEVISQPFGEPTWTLAYLSAKIVRSGVIRHFRAESKDQSASSATGCTNLNTIGILAGVARQPQGQPSKIGNKKRGPCPYSFKCLNFQGDHQADSNQCPFWRHRFNREWHQRKYTEIHENRSKLIHSEGNSLAQQWLWKKLKNLLRKNVHKNSLIVNTLLETANQFNIILIQEPPWSEIWKISSTSNSNSEPLIGTIHHPNWISFTRIPSDETDFPRVIAYINIQLSSLCFLFCKDIINHRDISVTIDTSRKQRGFG